MGQRHDAMSLHEACYRGRVDVVAQRLANGADPNEPADPIAREWISCGGSRPRPLNCVATAWAMTENHVGVYSSMTKLKELERDTAALSEEELSEFRRWNAECDARVRDRELEGDVRAGGLDQLAEEALADYRAGRSRPR